jgi:cytochrome c oxidase subunit 4
MNEHHVKHHVIPVRTYVTIYVILMVLLALTVGAAFIDLGPLNLLVALAIAVTKAVLIVLFFMHIRYASRLSMLFAGIGFFWLLILFSQTLTDYFTRGWLTSPGH